MTLNRDQAQQRADDIQAFRRELQRLGQEQALSLDPGQLERLAAHHRQLLDAYRHSFVVVLELDGPAYQAELALQRQLVEQARLAQAALPEDKQLGERLEHETRDLDRLERDTRLYAVDVGLDRATLRQRYPDRSRYAIVHGLVRPNHWSDKPRLAGHIGELSIEQINVPQRWRAVLDSLPSGPNNASRTPQQRIEVAFGQRLEPWITAVSDATQE